MSAVRSAALEAAVAAAAQELGLERPRVAGLAGGAANRSVRLSDSRQDLVLRLRGAAAAVLGANPTSEIAIQGIAAKAGLAPAIRLAAPALGFLVTPYVPGRVPDRDQMRDPAFLLRLGAWIARLHRLAPPGGLAVVDFGERAAGYLERARGRRRDRMPATLAAELRSRRAALAQPSRLVACHHDLHHRNIVDAGDRLLVVDWEYAGPGDPAADLAACIGYHELDALRVDALLAGYGADSRALRERLAALSWIFDCLWFGWNAVAALEGLECDRALQERLASRLAR